MAALLMLPAAAAVALEAEISKIDATAYEQMARADAAVGSKGGLVQPVSVPGRHFVAVSMTLKIAWDEKTSRFSAKGEQIQLEDSAKKTYPAVGMISKCQFLPSASSLWISRPWRWKQNPVSSTTATYVFLVPQDTKELTLKVGELQKAFTIGRAAKAFELQATPILKVVRARFAEAVSTEIRLGKEKIPVKVSAPFGKLLAVELTIQPTAGNPDPRNFFFMTRWVGLVYKVGGGSGYVSAAGQFFFGGLSTDVSNNNNADTKGRFSARSYRFFFVVPEGATGLELTWLMKPVAKFAVGEPGG
jgi:hypothetical protein